MKNVTMRNSTGGTAGNNQVFGTPLQGFVSTSASVPITPRAHAVFNGSTGALLATSWNVSSITKNGTGDYFVNFATALADAQFVVIGNARGATVMANNGGSNTTTRAAIATVNTAGAAVDVTYVSVVVF